MEPGMKRSLFLALSVAVAALAGAASAQTFTPLDPKSIDDWRTVDLGSGVSLDVPKAVGDAYRPDDKTDSALALFRVSVTDAGAMYCALDKLGYDKPPLGMNRSRALD